MRRRCTTAWCRSRTVSCGRAVRARCRRSEAPTTPSAELGLNRIDKDRDRSRGLTLTLWTANVLGVEDGNHPWDGLAPFPHFEPGQFEAACSGVAGPSGSASASTAAGRDQEFNQPSSFALLQKTPAQLNNPHDTTGAGSHSPALLSPDGALDFSFSRDSARLVLDDTRKTFMGGQGLNVLARAQTYYHRPGNWHEQPNFFNPYWKPRLASVWQGRYAMPLVGDWARGLPAPLDAMPQRAVTH